MIVEFLFKNQTNFYKGKVRDVYTIADKYLVMVASDRISAFDVVLPKTIPYKGQVLNELAYNFLSKTKHIVKNWSIIAPFPTVTVGYKCEPYKVEVVVRGYLAGHSWREYQLGKREICGVKLPEGMIENQKFEHPIITPTTKADFGHDQDISRDNIIKQNIVTEIELDNIYTTALKLFEFGSEHAKKQGLILVDTKYEFGKLNNELCLMDEIHTPDSSRYFIAKNYANNLKNNLPQEQLSKEFVRQWLIANNFQGKENQILPVMTDVWVETISEKYIELYEKISGEKFVKSSPLSKDEFEILINSCLASLQI
jgi:phosphoribosylaminoimidazole-succinocarboxamide synthase